MRLAAPCDSGVCATVGARAWSPGDCCLTRPRAGAFPCACAQAPLLLSFADACAECGRTAVSRETLAGVSFADFTIGARRGGRGGPRPGEYFGSGAAVYAVTCRLVPDAPLCMKVVYNFGGAAYEELSARFGAEYRAALPLLEHRNVARMIAHYHWEMPLEALPDFPEFAMPRRGAADGDRGGNRVTTVFVMELFEEENLLALLRRAGGGGGGGGAGGGGGGVAAAPAAAVPERAMLVALSVLQVARGLEHVLRAGVVHRDVKCDNVFVRARDAAGVPVVAIGDFGCALPVDAAFKLNYDGAVSRGGVADHLPPEVMTAPVRSVIDYSAADAYGLGCLLGEALDAVALGDGGGDDAAGVVLPRLRVVQRALTDADPRTRLALPAAQLALQIAAFVPLPPRELSRAALCSAWIREAQAALLRSLVDGVVAGGRVARDVVRSELAEFLGDVSPAALELRLRMFER